VERQPIESVTTTAIAARAGLPVGSLYQYFPNRLAILAELGREVLREIDDVTVSALERAGSVPWEEAVDAVVDGTLAAHRDRARTAVLFRSLAPTPAFRTLADESNRRLAAALARHPALSHGGLAPEVAARIARVTIEAGDAIQRLVLQTDCPAEAQALAVEMKKLLQAYLGLHLQEGRA